MNIFTSAGYCSGSRLVHLYWRTIFQYCSPTGIQLLLQKFNHNNNLLISHFVCICRECNLLIAQLFIKRIAHHGINFKFWLNWQKVKKMRKFAPMNEYSWMKKGGRVKDRQIFEKTIFYSNHAVLHPSRTISTFKFAHNCSLHNYVWARNHAVSRNAAVFRLEHCYSVFIPL